MGVSINLGTILRMVGVRLISFANCLIKRHLIRHLIGHICYDQLFIMRQDIRYKYILVPYKYILIRQADRSRIRISQV